MTKYLVNLTEDLACYWGLGETSGIRADAVNGVSLIPSGDPGSAPGVRIGLGASFDGINDILYTNNPETFTQMGSNGYTVGTWVKFTSLATTQFIMGRWTIATPWPGYYREWRVIVSNGIPSFWVTVNDVPIGVYANSFGTLNTGVWYFICAFYDNDPGDPKMGIGVNNVWDIVSAPMPPLDSHPLAYFSLGAQLSTGFYFDGVMDESFVYRRLLSSAERSWYYNDGKGRNYPSVVSLSFDMVNPGAIAGSIIVYWPLEEDTGIRKDSSGGLFYDLLPANNPGNDVGIRRRNALKLVRSSSQYLYNTDLNRLLTFPGSGAAATFTCWVKLNSIGGGQTQHIISRWDDTGVLKKEYKLYIGPDKQVHFDAHNDVTQYSITAIHFGELEVGRWYFITAFFGYSGIDFDSHMSVSVNNVETSMPIPFGSWGTAAGGLNTVYVGCKQVVDFFDGLIDELSIYRRDLSNEETMFLYYYGYGRTYEFLLDYTPPAVPYTPNPDLSEIIVYILDSNLVITRIIEDFMSLIWTERYNESGDFELELPINYSNFPDIDQDNFVYFTGSDSIMIIESVKPNITEEKSTVLITGRTADILLNRRVLESPLNIDGPVELFLYNLMLDNVSDPKDVNRKIAIFTTQIPILYEKDIYANTFERQKVYPVLESIAKETRYGFKIIYDRTITPASLYFIIYKGVDRSMSQTNNIPVIFSYDLDNVINSSVYISSPDEANAIYVITDDTVPALQANLIYIWPVPQGMNRFEEVLETTIERDPGGGAPLLTDAEVYEIIVDRGREAIHGTKQYALFDGEFDINGVFKYGIDFYIGDIVQCVLHGRDVQARLIEVVRSYSEEGIRINVTFDFIP